MSIMLMMSFDNMSPSRVAWKPVGLGMGERFGDRDRRPVMVMFRVWRVCRSCIGIDIEDCC